MGERQRQRVLTHDSAWSMLVANVFRPWRFAMSVNGDAARRDMRAGRIERCLAADMTVKEWCALNKVAESSLCK